MKDIKVRRSICEVPEVFEMLQDMAYQENRSFSNMVMQLCHEAIMAREEKRLTNG